MSEPDIDQHTTDRHSEEIQEIISKPPNWLLKSGIPLLSFILIILLIISGMISYPDKLNLSLEICAAHGKQMPTVQTAGVLVKLLAKDGDAVKTGQSLAYMDARYDHAIILDLLSDLKKLKGQLSDGNYGYNFPADKYTHMKAGELQPLYSEFSNMLHQQPPAAHKNLIVLTDTLINKIQAWKSKYIITASGNGKLNFTTIVQEGQNFKAGSSLFLISSPNDSFYGKIYIPESYTTKIKEGQPVIIKLTSHSATDFNELHGNISFKSSIPVNSQYISKVTFTYPNANNESNKLLLVDGMKLNAEIITQQSTILNRILNNMKARL